ncbi:MAG: type II toxin-antitoxin system HicB family antitoxin [Planctomycetes bacterium]|nr:type II toxin-antitoxin system HicB family antitoxin [Planctomycetota bacterium]
MALTTAYVPAKEGGYVAEILEATGVHTQGESFEEARKNLLEVIALMLEEAPHQFGDREAEAPPGALMERIFVLLPE